jgi:hypothetical protein
VYIDFGAYLDNLDILFQIIGKEHETSAPDSSEKNALRKTIGFVHAAGCVLEAANSFCLSRMACARTDLSPV